MEKVQIAVPYPPSTNHYWRSIMAVGRNRTRVPRVLISARGRMFRLAVQSACYTARLKPMAGALRVDVYLYPPDKRRRDIDNCSKALLDALQHGGAYQDDQQIQELYIRRCAVRKGGIAYISMRQLSVYELQLGGCEAMVSRGTSVEQFNYCNGEAIC